MSKRDLLQNVMDLLARFRDKTSSSEEQQLLAVAIDAMLFIGSTSQRQAFMDFLTYLDSNSPPPVVAAFKTREEADEWLTRQADPPDSALVLIADQYHTVMHHRERNHRQLVPLAIMEFHLGRLKRDGLPPRTATFENREQAWAWFTQQAHPPEQSLVTIAGEDYLAVHHRGVHHRALYPFSISLDEEP